MHHQNKKKENNSKNQSNKKVNKQIPLSAAPIKQKFAPKDALTKKFTARRDNPNVIGHRDRHCFFRKH
jgi:hypothetical protein